MPPPLPEPSLSDRWLQQQYAAYYRDHPPQLPDRFGKREYGFIFFGQRGMLRHVGFARRSQFEDFHAQRGPAHSYYSTAFYQDPGAPTMQEKGWMAAELIFDLDADHVPGSEKLPYPQQLARVKEFFVRLVDEFVVRDFGFSEEDLLLTFSGGRGYHCHVLHEKALALTSQERREIVDYVTGTGLDLERFLQVQTVSGSTAATAMRSKKPMKVATADSPGWNRRLNEGLRRYLGDLRTMPRDQCIEALSAIEGITAKDAQYIQRQLPLLTDEHIAGGYIDRGAPFRKLIPAVLEQQVVSLAKGETDEPVTSDTKRLIRTPGSLHGKSGLRVVTLTRDELTDFDPLRDAVAFGDEEVEVEVVKPVSVQLKGEKMDLEPGRRRVPQYGAVFAVLRGAAAPVQRP